ncbi:MAG: hypothetical protein Q8O25_04705 [Sulfurisoma sp.]|nr:hypothetical protein [Sulfurisoma sp.]
MDDSMTASLKETRFTRFHAALGTGVMPAGGGKLKAEILAELQETEDRNQTVAQVTIKITGTPQQATESAEPAFQVEVVGQGLYEWPEGERPADLAQKSVNRQLCLPIYALTVSEVIQLAQRMGVNGVKIPWDMPIDKMETATAKKSRARKPTAKPATARLKTAA